VTMNVNGLYKPINFIVGIIYIYIYIKQQWNMYNYINKYKKKGVKINNERYV
jgi:hypothetical protein